MPTDARPTDDAPDTLAVVAPPASRRWWVGVAVAVVVVIAAAVVLLRGAEDEPLPGILRQPPLDASGLEFLDYAGADEGVPTDLVPDEGGVTLAYFGYLSCPDVCPTTLADVRVALDRLDPDQVQRVTVAFVTVDPERDTGPDIRDYLGAFYGSDDGPAVAALRADGATSLQDAADRLGVMFEIADHPAGAERYDVGHSAITYVVDDTGTVVRELPFGARPDDYERVLRAALADQI